ncbi:MAG TPA: C4-dicarboxylate ABC transporter [Gammaproteobacteria bacterium]|nr:C4-dicarboxylate ABC transporter [Gammaproteobacteria bacterium]
MSSITLGAMGVLAALVLIALRVPIAVALGLVSFFGIMELTNMRAALGIITAVPFNFIGNWSFTAVPMFLLMGYVCTTSGMTQGLFQAMRVCLSRLPGGLAIASVGACSMFAAASGSSVATASAMARIAVPEMLRHRYDRGLATGVIAASGTLGSLIPPSILMVLYGVYAEVSIGKLFMAGFLPGLLSAALYVLMIVARVKLTPGLAGKVEQHFTGQEKWDAIKEVWALPTLIIFVLGGIFAGFFTPTEAGAVGAFLATALAILRGKFSRLNFIEALTATARGTGSIFIILIGTIFLTKFLALSGLPAWLASTMLSVSDSVVWIIVSVAIIYIILGMFVDSIGLLLLTLPLLLPIANGADMNLIWFGIILIKLLEIGLVSPPVGLNVYVIKGAVGNSVPLQTIFKGVGWFIVMDIVALLLIISFPELSLYLPSIMDI